MEFLAAAASSYLVACFIFAGWSKARNFQAFSASVAAIAPPVAKAAPILAAIVIAAEIAAALLFIASLAELSTVIRQLAAATSLGLAITFAGAIAGVLMLGRDVSCNCFGEADSMIAIESLLSPALLGLASGASLLELEWPESASTLAVSASAGIYLLLLHRLLLLHLAGSTKVRPQ